MSAISPALEQELLQKVRQLSAEKQQVVLDFAAFLLSKSVPQQKNETIDPADIVDPVDVVERTWGNLALDKKTAMYIAEDKELEYDV